MKNTTFYFVFIFILLACKSNHGTEISQQEFYRILATDTIESIQTYDDCEFANIRIRGGKDHEYLMLRISSYKNFQDSLDILIDSLQENYNIHPIINSSAHVGLTIPSKDGKKPFKKMYWLLLVLPFILVLFYEIKGGRKINKS